MVTHDESNQDMVQILPVAEYLDYINYVLQITEQVRVSGEISSLNHHPSGVYMTLKDPEKEAILDCYISNFTYRGMGLPVEPGMQIVMGGSAGIYKPKGRLSFRVETIEPLGEGSLKKAYELLKKKLDEEGLFLRKRELPLCIKTIGVVTSRTGAVIDDFRNNLKKRGYRVILADTRVEGKQAESMISNRIKQLLKKEPDIDCLVLMRGGGSLEDLAAFNSESVVRALFSSPVPTIAAIGHDRDVPLVCLAADHFTSTPTAAAVLVNSTWQELEDSLHAYEQSIFSRFENQLSHRIQTADHLSASLLIRARQLVTTFQRLSDSFTRSVTKLGLRIKSLPATTQQFQQRIIKSQSEVIMMVQNKILERAKQLEQLSPERQLKLGYSITRSKTGKIIRQTAEVSPGDPLTIQLTDGEISTTVNT